METSTAHSSHNIEPQAEHIAALRFAAVSRIGEAASLFDSAGQHYWEGEQTTATDECRRAFAALRRSKDELLEASRLSVPLTAFHVKSPKSAKAKQLYLGGEEYSPEYFTATLLIQDRRLISDIEHLLACETIAVDSMAAGNLDGVYHAVSAPGRRLVEQAAGYTGELIRVARVAHEVSDIVMAAWEVEEAIPEAAAEGDRRVETRSAAVSTSG